MAILIPADSTKEVKWGVKPLDKKFTLEELYDHIGCSTIEMLTLPDGRVMVSDEESKLTDTIHMNERASLIIRFPRVWEFQQMMQKMKGSVIITAGYAMPDDPELPADFIAGDVLLCYPEEVS